MTAGPEICNLAKEYEFESDKQNTILNHHEDIPSAQKSFYKDVTSLTDCINDYGNPFLEESDELFNLVSKKVSCSKDLYEYEKRGKEQFEYYKTNLKHFELSIRKNSFYIFGNPVQKKKKFSNQQLKKDCILFQIYL